MRVAALQSEVLREDSRAAIFPAAQDALRVATQGAANDVKTAWQPGLRA